MRRAGRVVAPDLACLVLATCLALTCCGGVARANYDTCERAVGWDVERGTDTWELAACRPESVDLGRLARVHVEPADATCGDQRERFCNLVGRFHVLSTCVYLRQRVTTTTLLIHGGAQHGRCLTITTNFPFTLSLTQVSFALSVYPSIRLIHSTIRTQIC